MNNVTTFMHRKTDSLKFPLIFPRPALQSESVKDEKGSKKMVFCLTFSDFGLILSRILFEAFLHCMRIRE